MYKISIEKNVPQSELTEFLTEVDKYFTVSLHICCKQSNLYIWAGCLLKKASFVIARNENEKIIGCLIFYPNKPEEFIYVSVAVVLKEYQHKHIAVSMFDCLLLYAKESNRLGLHLQTYRTNLIALAFYKRVGFIKKEADSSIQLISLYKKII